MQARLSQSQIHYMRTVLGVESIVLSATPAGPQPAFEMRGTIASAKLIACVPLFGAEFPLAGEAQDLVLKMLKAMKIDSREVLLLSWEHGQARVEEACEIFLSAGDRPILFFGHGDLTREAGLNLAPGQWAELGKSRVLATYAPRELAAAPDLKKTAWVHLQAMMKVL